MPNWHLKFFAWRGSLFTVCVYRTWDPDALSVLKSKRAVQVNIAIMRTFAKLREVLSTHKALARKFSELEKKVGGHDALIRDIVVAIRKMIKQTAPENALTKPKGFPGPDPYWKFN